MGNICCICKKDKSSDSLLFTSGRYCFKCDLLFENKIDYRIHMGKNHKSLTTIHGDL